MKKLFFLLVCALVTLSTHAQFKIHNDGRVSIGSLSRDLGVQVQPNGYVFFRTTTNNAYSWATLSRTNHFCQKHWIIENHYNHADTCYEKHMFYVYGNGYLFSTGNYNIPSTQCLYRSNPITINGREALETILNLTGYYFDETPMITPEEIESSEYVDKAAVEGMIEDLRKRSVGFSADNLAEVFPDAVRTDPEGRLCINYNAVVTMLTEALKQQQTEIEELRMVLNENGLLKP